MDKEVLNTVRNLKKKKKRASRSCFHNEAVTLKDGLK